MVSSTISTTAASLYSFQASAFFAICSASALALASIAKASASPFTCSQHKRKSHCLISFEEDSGKFPSRKCLYQLFLEWVVKSVWFLHHHCFVLVFSKMRTKRNEEVSFSKTNNEVNTWPLSNNANIWEIKYEILTPLCCASMVPANQCSTSLSQVYFLTVSNNKRKQFFQSSWTAAGDNVLTYLYCFCFSLSFQYDTIPTKSKTAKQKQIQQIT